MKALAGFAFVAFLALFLAGCAHKHAADIKPEDVIVACPDDGVHIVVNGVCTDTSSTARAEVPCPNDGRHLRVNDVCVYVLGK